jgi:alginate O-acetyltransferase complex protein AlgI
MLFNSFSFVFLVIITLSLYYLPLMRRLQILILIIASFVFYWNFGKVRTLYPLLGITAVNILASYFICYGDKRFRRLVAVAGVLIDLGLLAYGKYSSRMPLGLSFIVFQQISLLVDTFRADRIDLYKDLVSRSPYAHALNVTLFTAFFPKVAAGPITKAHDFLPQIGVKYLKDVDWEYAGKTLILGYFLKMVIADNLKDHTFWIAYPYFLGLSTTHLLFLTFGYSMQFFADFAGYSLIAIAIASLFGYRLPDNFKFPYIARSFSEFWTRWHISLSSFLKEYLYIPLGGNRKGTLRTYVNLMIVMFLGGVWHGATWNFAVWGVCHGAFLTVERILRTKISLPENWITKAFQTMIVFLCVNFAWLIFCLPDFSHTIKYFHAILDNTALRVRMSDIAAISIYSLPVVLYHVHYLWKRSISINRPARLEYVGYGIMLFLIITNSGSPTKFVYFQF